MPLALALRERRHRDAGIDRDDAFVVGEERVDVEGPHFGEVGRELGELDEDERDGGTVGRRHVAIGSEDPRDTGAGDLVLGQLHVEGRKGQGLVVDDFDGRAATPEHDHRSEDRVVRESRDQLPRPLPPDHGLHQHSRHRGAGPEPRRAGQDVGRRRADILLRREVEGDAVDLGLVHDIRRDDLHRDGVAGEEDRTRGCRCLIR